MKAVFEETVWKKIYEVSKREFPLEACSILAGRKKGDLFEVKLMIEAENRQSSRSSFKIDPKFLVDKVDEIEEREMEHIGFFHTHPDMSSFVSERDEKFMELWPGKIWTIAGTDDQGEVNDVRAFVWVEGIEEVNIESVDKSPSKTRDMV